MVWIEAEAIYALHSIRKDADHPVGRKLSGEYQADTFGAQYQPQHVLMTLPMTFDITFFHKPGNQAL